MSKSETPVEAAPAPDPGAVDTERLMQELGQLKPFHLKNYALLAIACFFAAIYGINYVFLAADVDYRYLDYSFMS